MLGLNNVIVDIFIIFLNWPKNRFHNLDRDPYMSNNKTGHFRWCIFWFLYKGLEFQVPYLSKLQFGKLQGMTCTKSRRVLWLMATSWFSFIFIVWQWNVFELNLTYLSGWFWRIYYWFLADCLIPIVWGY